RKRWSANPEIMLGQLGYRPARYAAKRAVDVWATPGAHGGGPRLGSNLRSLPRSDAPGQPGDKVRNPRSADNPPSCPRRESNLDLPLRRRSSYPLDYEGAVRRS